MKLTISIKFCCLLALIFCILCPVHTFGDTSTDLHNVKPAFTCQILEGTLIPVVLTTGIDTTQDGTLIAQVALDIYDTATKKYLLIPKGSKILGKYFTKREYSSDANVSYRSRVLVTFFRIIRPNGTSILLGGADSADKTDSQSVEENVDNYWKKIENAATISTNLSIGAGVAGDSGNSDAIPPTVTLTPGKKLTVAVKKNMVLPRYISQKTKNP